MSLVADINLLLNLQRVKPLRNVISNSRLIVRSFVINNRSHCLLTTSRVSCYNRYAISQFNSKPSLIRQFSNSKFSFASKEPEENLRKIQKSTNPSQPSQSPTSSPASPSPTTPAGPLKENIWTVPNILTMSRLAAAPVIGYLVVDGQTFWALSLVVYSGITDLLDGYIARRFNMQSVVGSVIDPLADKALMMTLATCLGVSGDIPLYMAVIILGRDILLGLSAFYYRYISLPPPITFKRYWDFSIPSAEVHPTTISKYNTFFQMVYLGSSLLYPVIQSSLETATAETLSLGLGGMGYLVATTTIWSGVSYIFSDNAVKILKPRK